MTIQRQLGAIVALVIALPILSCDRHQAQEPGDNAWRVCTMTPLDHPSLQAALDGFESSFREAAVGKRFTFQKYDASGDPLLIEPLLRATVRDKCSLVFVVTSTAAATARRTVAEAGIPIVFTAVTDPVGAGVITNGEEKLPITGFTDRYPTALQVRLFMQITPQAKTAAILFNPNKQNSRFLVNETEEQFTRAGVNVLRFANEDSSQVFAVTSRAAQEADILVVNGDNLFTENLETVIRIGQEHKKPVFVGDPESVRRGAVATVGPDYNLLGRASGQRAFSILSGTAPSSLPIGDPQDYDYVINVEAARKFGISVPPEVFLANAPIWRSQQ